MVWRKESLVALLTKYESLSRVLRELEERKREIQEEFERKYGRMEDVQNALSAEDPRLLARILGVEPPPAPEEIKRSTMKEIKKTLRDLFSSIETERRKDIVASLALRALEQRDPERASRARLIAAEFFRRKGYSLEDLALLNLGLDLMNIGNVSLVVLAYKLGVLERKEILRLLREVHGDVQKMMGMGDEEYEKLERAVMDYLGSEEAKRVVEIYREILEEEAREKYEEMMKNRREKHGGKVEELRGAYEEYRGRLEEIEREMEELERRREAVIEMVKEWVREEKEKAVGRLVEAVRSHEGLTEEQREEYVSMLERGDLRPINWLFGKDSFQEERKILEINPDRLLKTFEKLGKRSVEVE